MRQNTEIVPKLSPAYITEVEPVTVTIHPSRFPERIRAAYLESFRKRRMNHQFHYLSEKQAQQWLALHEAYSPARTDEDCLRTYEFALSEIGGKIRSKKVELISIGCGGGQKDRALLKYLRASETTYFPIDVSLPLALTAHLAAPSSLSSKPVLLDLAGAADFPAFLDGITAVDAERVIAFFGMLPNFEPAEALPTLASAVRPGEALVFSANLAPGPDYRAGVEKTAPLYDNELTRRWLATALLDAGLEISPDEIEFSIVESNGLLRIEANYRFRSSQTIRIDTEQFSFARGEVFRLFFSYRHTPEILERLLEQYGLRIAAQWITKSREEGIFLAQKSL